MRENRLIGDALKAQIDGLSFNPAIPVAYPNRDFTPPADRWILASIERAENGRVDLGDGTRFSGSVVLIVCTKPNKGSGEGEDLADAIATAFQANIALPIVGGGHVRVTARPSVRSGYLDGGWWRTPVVVPFAALLT